VEGRFAALVRGPSPVFPRGILAVVVVWYVAASVALLAVYRLLDWYGPVALAGLLLGVLTLVAVLSTMRNNAFVADGTAIWLGLRAGARRRVGRRRRALRALPWSDIEQVRITWRPYGVRVDIMLGPAAPLVGRAHPVLSGFAGIMLLVLPASYLVRLPSLIVPHASPPRYRVQIYDLRPEAVRAALTALAPRTVAVTVYSVFGRPRVIHAPPPAGIARPAVAGPAAAGTGKQAATQPVSMAAAPAAPPVAAPAPAPASAEPGAASPRPAELPPRPADASPGPALVPSQPAASEPASAAAQPPRQPGAEAAQVAPRVPEPQEPGHAPAAGPLPSPPVQAAEPSPEPSAAEPLAAESSPQPSARLGREGA
jgi:hypothetical protein